MAGFSALILAAVLAAAAMGKLRNRPAATTTARQLGVPSALAMPVVSAAVMTELVTAGLLIAPGSLRIGSGLGGLLVLMMTALTAKALAEGRRPTCACFGQQHATPMGGGTLLRNVALIGLAATAFLPGVPSFWWDGVRSVSATAIVVGCALTIVVLLSIWAVVELMRQQGRLLLRIEALEQLVATGHQQSVMPALLPIPRDLPAVFVTDETGAVRSVGDIPRLGESILLLFTDEDCATCQELLPGLLASHREGSLGLDLAVVSRQAVSHPPARVFVDAEGRATAAFGITGVPSAVFVGGDGRMPYAVAAGWPAISALLAARGEHRSLTPVAPAQLTDSFARRTAGVQ